MNILLVQPSLQPPGGGNAVAAWMIEALKNEHAVSALTWEPVDVTSINRYYGTALQPGDFTALTVSAIVRAPVNLLRFQLALFKYSMLLRTCKQIQDGFDLIIGTHNEADFGRRGIQYVHFPWSYMPRPPTDLHWYHGSGGLVRAYYDSCVRLCSFSFEATKHNLTLTNSDWTAGKVRERYGIDSVTLYPPVSGTFPEVPWDEREAGFVCIGRISPEKELDKVIDILSAVRGCGHDIHLHIVGNSCDSAYHARLVRRIADTPWVRLDTDVSRAALERLLATHRYGIHGMTQEHFGIGVAELVHAGCIVFVPNGGGQVEIVGDEGRLRYDNVDDAARKIIAVLGGGAPQHALRAHLAQRAALFSTAQFAHRLRAIVRQFAASEPTGAPPIGR